MYHSNRLTRLQSSMQLLHNSRSSYRTQSSFSLHFYQSPDFERYVPHSGKSFIALTNRVRIQSMMACDKINTAINWSLKTHPVQTKQSETSLAKSIAMGRTKSYKYARLMIVWERIPRFRYSPFSSMTNRRGADGTGCFFATFHSVRKRKWQFLFVFTDQYRQYEKGTCLYKSSFALEPCDRLRTGVRKPAEGVGRGREEKHTIFAF